MINPKNHPHINTTCPECKHTEILQDPEQEIIYCTRCGLVIQENSIFKITEEIERIEYRIKFIRNLWKK